MIRPSFVAAVATALSLELLIHHPRSGAAATAARQTAAIVTPVRVASVKPIEPPAHPLPAESASAGAARFSFLAYGDSRCNCRSPSYDARTYYPGLEETQPEHSQVMNTMVAKAKSLAGGEYPVRFILQSGDAVWRGADAERWPVFNAIAERATVGAGLPFFFVPGNHDTTPAPPGDPNRALGLHNMFTAFSKLNPPEGSPRRLSGYGTFAFGYGNVFVVGFDSNVADDRAQLAWVTGQLEHLDRARYRHVIALFHHPVLSSGRYSGVPSQALLPNGMTASGSVGPQAAALRDLYLPLFRTHHITLMITGHDHLFDHWVERYVDASGAHRMDQIVSGGGGAPTYVYTGEPDLTAYLAAGAANQVRVEHLAKPGATIEDNPHHFLVIQVDGDRISVETVGVRPYAPYGGRSRIDLQD
jgi:hypothetical protein